MRTWTAPLLRSAVTGTANRMAQSARLLVGGFLVLAFLAFPPDGAGSLEAVPLYQTDHHTTALQWATDESSSASAVERRLVSQVVDAPSPFSALAVHWRGTIPEGAAVQFEARVRTGETWGPWRLLGQAPAYVPGIEGWDATRRPHAPAREASHVRG